jgi:SAM-dependent methyltransferase
MTTEADVSAVSDAMAWILKNVRVRLSNSAEFLFDRMGSQCAVLAVIYVPFDGAKRGHFVDRGQILDFALAAKGGRVLDFGPGDGWPSLLMAPMVSEVIGVDGSRTRVEACTRNARRMGIQNAAFVHVPPGQRLPFDDHSFDAVVAASSIEQTPDARATLMEICRVLKPGGRLRLDYESLSYYGNDRSSGVGLSQHGRGSDLVIFERDPNAEAVRYVGLSLDLSPVEVREFCAACGADIHHCSGLRPEVLRELRAHATDTVTWTQYHPSCNTLLRWLPEIGFSVAKATYNGGWLAGELFDRTPVASRPRDIAEIDELLRPLVEIIVTMETPLRGKPGEWDPMVSATK